MGCVFGEFVLVKLAAVISKDKKFNNAFKRIRTPGKAPRAAD
jgi:hypothetical protein